MNNHPKTFLVSVIIPCFKMGKYVGEALASVEAQTICEWEIIVVDDAGPEDGTRQVVADFATKCANHRIIYLRHGENLGVSAARNTAIAHSHGSLLAFLDPDDFWLPSHLEQHLQVHQRSQGALISASGVKVFTDQQPEGNGDVWATSRWEAKMFPAFLVMRNSMNPSAVVASAEAVKLLGGFDVDPEIQHAEDWDLWLRLAEAGVPFIFIHEITAGYRRHPGAATTDLKAMQRRARAVISKHSHSWPGYMSEVLFRQQQRIEHLEMQLEKTEKSSLVRASRRLDRFLRILRSWFKRGSV